MNSETRIKFQCPFCSRPMNAPANAAGKKGRCKDCNYEVIVPTDNAAEPAEMRQEAPATRPALKKPLTPRWMRTPGAIALLVVIVGVSYSVSQWTETRLWISDDGLRDYADTYGYWSGKMQNRSVYERNQDDEGVSLSHGPMSETETLHGEWTISIFKPEYRSKKIYFWYGDEVSEGEWHTRSGK
jgi:hypothetical protein